MKALLAMKTWPPGRKVRVSSFDHSTKNSRRDFLSWSLSAVNLGSGERRWPSNDGGILQIPPLPFARFSICSEWYSLTP
jgi:hypothetical protein